MIEALFDVLASGWLGLSFVLCVLAALPLGAGAWLARSRAGESHWLPRSLALASAVVVVLSLRIWLPMVTNALDAARLAFDGADVATRSAIFALRHSVGVYGLALGLGVHVFGFGCVLLGAFGARQRGGS